jgi:hypothetical protein
MRLYKSIIGINMTIQTIGTSRLAQRTSGAVANANFSELYARQINITLPALAAAGTFVVPAGYILEHIAYANNTANAVTGGLKFGKTLAAADVVAAQAVGANAIGTVTGANVLLRFFSKTVDQTIYIDTVTAWNSATVDIFVVLRKLT